MSRWRIRMRRRTHITPFFHVNWDKWKLIKAIFDGPGGKRVRDAISSHTWKIGLWSRNSRGRETFDFPGPGYAERGSYRPRRPEGRTNWRGCLVVVLLLVTLVWAGIDWFVIPWWELHIAPAWEQARHR